MTKEKELYGRIKHNIKPMRSNKYLTWLRKKNHDKEIHHLIGSQGSLKLSDYLIVAITREEHQRAEAFKILYFFDNLHIAINNLIDYVRELEMNIEEANDLVKLKCPYCDEVFSVQRKDLELME